MGYWLVKSEPFKFSWDQLVKDKHTTWDGVRNYTARNNLRAMKKNDQVLFYHSNEGMEVVGIAKVSKESYPDPTTEIEAWVAVNLKAFKKFKRPVSLSEIKGKPLLANMDLVRLGRLSVQSVKEEEWMLILELSNKKL